MIMISNVFCLPSPAAVHELFSVARDANAVPDVSLDGALTSFLSLDSSSALHHQYSTLHQTLTAEQLARFTSTLSHALGGAPRVSYGGVGVVALALSLLFDILAHQARTPEGGGASAVVVDHTQRVTGISNSSRIGAIVGGYLWRAPGVANDPVAMAEVTELYDGWLKLELIDHYDRMTNKKRMGTDAMRQWLAGAAFHLHLRLHQIRLGSVPRGSAESLRLSYRTGFSRLVQGYAAYLRRSVQETPPADAAAAAKPGRGRGRGVSRDEALGPSGVAGLSEAALGPSGVPDLSEAALGPSGVPGLSEAALGPSVVGGRSEAALGPSGVPDLSEAALGPSDTWQEHSRTAEPPSGRSGESSPAVGPSGPALGPRAVSPGSGPGPGPGLLVVEPERNVSHWVRHRPCESPAIADALVTRIMAAQDLQGTRNFFVHGEKYFNRLLSQRAPFQLHRRPDGRRRIHS